MVTLYCPAAVCRQECLTGNGEKGQAWGPREAVSLQGQQTGCSEKLELSEITPGGQTHISVLGRPRPDREKLCSGPQSEEGCSGVDS